MLIILKKEAGLQELASITKYLDSLDIDFSVWHDKNCFFLGLRKIPEPTIKENLRSLPYVADIIEEYPSESKTETSSPIKIKNFTVNSDTFLVIAGPCTIDDKEELRQTARLLKQIGINFLRGGAFKLRSSPYSYQGLGKDALTAMKEVCDELNMISVSELTSTEDLALMEEYIDIIIIGTRNMQNFRLLSALGKTSKPVILKRGMASSIKEWILAAEYIKKEGNGNIMLCERGIRTFENYTRNTLDISAVPAAKSLAGYPVLVDPSHSSGKKEFIKPLSWAAAASGADGLIIECHAEPHKAKCDARQTIDIHQLEEILKNLPQITGIWNKSII